MDSAVVHAVPERKRPQLLRVVPQALEAEQCILGGIMLSPEALDKVASHLSEADFYSADHRVIYRALCDLSARNQPLDAIVVGEWFIKNGYSRQIQDYLVELSNNTPSAANILAYADIVRDRSVKRTLADAGTSIVDAALDPHAEGSADLLATAEQQVFSIARMVESTREQLVQGNALMRSVVQTLQHRYDHRGELLGLSTGFRDVDKLTSGLQATDLIIVAGRPSMGKTAFALNIAESAAIKRDVPVLVFSMEMSADQLGIRLVSSLARVNQQALREGDIADEAWPRIGEATNAISKSKILIDETPALTPMDLRSRARRAWREHKIGLIVVDYIQLMHVPGSKENRATEVASITSSLKALAKELKIPVVALSQLNRSLEQRNDKRPVMSDLRESGAIEQDADVIMFLYRDEVYNKDSAEKGTAEVIVGKQRNGPIGTVKLTFLGQYTRFADQAPEAVYAGLQ